MIPLGILAAVPRRLGPGPLNQIAFFQDDMITSTGWEVAGHPGAFYDADEDRTYVAWQYIGLDKGVHIAYYDHSAGEWSSPVCAGHFILPDDDHGYASIVKDAEGYIHCLFGSHSTRQRWSVSNSPNDISGWRQLSDINGSLSYPKPALVGSTIYTLLRNDASMSRRMLVLTSLTPSAGLGTWASGINILDFGDDSRVYATEVHTRGAELHFCCTRANSSDSVRRGVYYFIYDTATGHVLNYDRTVTVSTMPVSLAQANASFRVFDHGASGGDLPSLQFDSAGNAHVLFLDGVASPLPLKHIVLSGSAWSSPSTIANIVDNYPMFGYADSYHLTPGADGQMEAWYNLGGDKYRRLRGSAGEWSAPQLVAVHGERSFVQGTPVLHAHPELRVLFSEHAGDALDASALKLPMYAFGDQGFIEQVIDQERVDSLWDETTLLLSCRDGIGATSLIDDSRSARKADFSGAASIVSDGPFPGLRSIRTSASSDFVSVAHSNAFSASSGTFTVDCFLKLNAVGRLQYLVSKRGNATPDFALMVLATNQVYLNAWGGSGALVCSVGGGSLSAGLWYRLRGVIDGGTARVYIGPAADDFALTLVASGPVSGPIGSNSNVLTIGRDPGNTATRWLNGWISQIRLTQAVRTDVDAMTAPFPTR